MTGGAQRGRVPALDSECEAGGIPAPADGAPGKPARVEKERRGRGRVRGSLVRGNRGPVCLLRGSGVRQAPVSHPLAPRPGPPSGELDAPNKRRANISSLHEELKRSMQLLL